MNKEKYRICPVERAGCLDNGCRRCFQNPQKILKPYIDEGMTVLDLGGRFGSQPMRRAGHSGGCRVSVQSGSHVWPSKTGSAASIRSGPSSWVKKRLFKIYRERDPVAEKIFLHETNRVGRANHACTALKMRVGDDFGHGQYAPWPQAVKNLLHRGFFIGYLSKHGDQQYPVISVAPRIFEIITILPGTTTFVSWRIQHIPQLPRVFFPLLRSAEESPARE